MSRERIDCLRLLCPMPVIRVQDRIAAMRPGDELEAVCTDPGALNDIPAWCRINGHEVIGTRSEEATRRSTARSKSITFQPTRMSGSISRMRAITPARKRRSSG